MVDWTKAGAAASEAKMWFGLGPLARLEFMKGQSVFASMLT